VTQRQIVTPSQLNGATGAFQTKPVTPTIAASRKDMPFKVDTMSTTKKGAVRIEGVDKYPDEPMIYFTREAWVKQCYLVEKCSKEVGWFALVDYDEAGNSFTITELVIPCQEVTAAETDIGKEDLADAAMELIEAGKDTSKMFAWFHSHVNMGVSPSGQDEFQVEDFLKDLVDQPEVPCFIRGIQNKKGDLKLDVYYIQHGIAYQNVSSFVLNDDDPQWQKDIDAEILTKVTERVFTTTYYGNAAAAKKNPNVNGVGNVAPRHRWEEIEEFSKRNPGPWGGWDDVNDEDYGLYDYQDQNSPMGSAALGGLKAVKHSFTDYNAMDIVYQADNNMEVLSDANGILWVCDAKGDLYDYQEYTDACCEKNSTLPLL
jgi:hypothetical protein